MTSTFNQDFKVMDRAMLTGIYFAILNAGMLKGPYLIIVWIYLLFGLLRELPEFIAAMKCLLGMDK